jgi:uncharacterized protein YndB with AHSA1/START domain
MTGKTIGASRRVEASPEAVFAFLADLENHWALAADWVQVRHLERIDGGPARGAQVRLRGPLGLRRRARTLLLDLDPPARLAGTAEVGPRTCARVAWHLEPDGDGTLVRVSADIVALSPLDRLLWATAGRRVMARGFPAVLARLQSVLDAADSGSVALSSPAPRPTTR